MYIQQLRHMHIGYLACHEYVVQAQQTLLCLEIFVCFRKPFSVPEGYFPMLLPFEGMLLVAPKACFVATILFLAATKPLFATPKKLL